MVDEDVSSPPAEASIPITASALSTQHAHTRESCDFVPQKAPQAQMVAGLLAASRIRPTAKINAEPPELILTAKTADPWNDGIAKLQRMWALDGFTADRWELVQAGCAALLSDWGDEMRRLGWSTPIAPAIPSRPRR